MVDELALLISNFNLGNVHRSPLSDKGCPTCNGAFFLGSEVVAIDIRAHRIKLLWVYAKEREAGA